MANARFQIDSIVWPQNSFRTVRIECEMITAKSSEQSKPLQWEMRYCQYRSGQICVVYWTGTRFNLSRNLCFFYCSKLVGNFSVTCCEMLTEVYKYHVDSSWNMSSELMKVSCHIAQHCWNSQQISTILLSPLNPKRLQLSKTVTYSALGKQSDIKRRCG